MADAARRVWESDHRGIHHLGRRGDDRGGKARALLVLRCGALPGRPHPDRLLLAGRTGQPRGDYRDHRGPADVFDRPQAFVPGADGPLQPLGRRRRRRRPAGQLPELRNRRPGHGPAVGSAVHAIRQRRLRPPSIAALRVWPGLVCAAGGRAGRPMGRPGEASPRPACRPVPAGLLRGPVLRGVRQGIPGAG